MKRAASTAAFGCRIKSAHCDGLYLDWAAGGAKSDMCKTRPVTIASLLLLAACGSTSHREISQNYFELSGPDDDRRWEAEAFRTCPEGYELDSVANDRTSMRIWCINRETRPDRYQAVPVPIR
jgi:hypothetical protein